MGLPYSYTKKIDFDVNISLQKQDFLELLSQSLQHEEGISEINIVEEELVFKSKKSLLNFSYQVNTRVDITDKINFVFEANLVDLIKISLALIVVIPFLSTFNINTFFIFSSILIFIFYFANLIFILSSTKQTFEKALTRLNILQTEDMSIEQQDWLSDLEKCSACGYNISEYDLNCPDCGIMLKQNKFTKPLDISQVKPKKNQDQSTNQDISYHYKKKEK